MTSDEGLLLRADTLQVVIGDQLSVGSHPVTDHDVENGGELELVEHILGESLIIHGWQSVSVEEEQLLDHVENKEGDTGDGEQDWHSKAINEGDE